MKTPRVLVLAATVGIIVGTFASSALACPFCSEQRGPTFVEDFSKAAIVLLGTFDSSARGGTGRLKDSTTDFVVERAIKDHEVVKGKKIVTLPREVPPTKNKFLIFCDIYKGELDPYRGVELSSDTSMVKYLVGATATEGKPQGERLRFFFDYLNCPEVEIALDAYREYARADYKDYADMAKTLPAKTIAGWIEDPKTPAFRLGLYASLLGHCGTGEHAVLFKKLIEDPEARRGSGVDGIMAGLVMIEPKSWAYLDGMLLDAKQEFQIRYSVFRTARFLRDNRPDLVPKEQLVKSIADLIEVPDMSDFAIDELRRLHHFEYTKAVLDLFDKKSHSLSVIKRAILRFALQSPEESAKTFVTRQRARDLEWVTDTEELLKIETDVR